MPKNKKDPVVETDELTPDIVEIDAWNDEQWVHDLETEITKITKKLADQEEITKRAQSDYFRLKQEFDGYITRAEDGKKSWEIDSLVKTLTKILPFINSLEQSLSLTPEDLSGHKWVEGISLIYTKIIKDLEAMWVHKIEAEIWQDVDFTQHAPVGMEPTDDESMKNKIVKVIQQGYIYTKWETTKVVLPASVMVGG